MPGPGPILLPKLFPNALKRSRGFKLSRVFEMLKEQSFYQPKEGTYMKLLVLLGKARQPERASQLFDTMLEEGLEPTSELYTALLAAYSRSNELDEAFSVLRKMVALPRCQPDVYTYSILIKAWVDDHQFEMVESLYDQMTTNAVIIPT